MSWDVLVQVCLGMSRSWECVGVSWDVLVPQVCPGVSWDVSCGCGVCPGGCHGPVRCPGFLRYVLGMVLGGVMCVCVLGEDNSRSLWCQGECRGGTNFVEVQMSKRNYINLYFLSNIENINL